MTWFMYATKKGATVTALVHGVMVAPQINTWRFLGYKRIFWRKA